jgi:hypothetical protein
MQGGGGGWPVKPLVKRPGGFTYVRPRLKGAGKRIPDCMAYSLFPLGVVSDPKPCRPSPPPSSRGGGGGMVRADPSHSLSGTRWGGGMGCQWRRDGWSGDGLAVEKGREGEMGCQERRDGRGRWAVRREGTGGGDQGAALCKCC